MFEPEKAVVIANPASKGGWLGKNWHSIGAQLRDYLGPVNLQLTERVGHGAELAQQAIQDGVTTIVSFGGDGTHSETCDGVMRSGRSDEVNIGILHAGTGGDFRKLIQKSDDLEAACNVIHRGDAAPVDAGWVSYVRDNGENESRYFLNITSLGMGGLVDRYVAGSKRLFGGSAAYLSGTLRAQLKYKPARVSVEVDGNNVGEYDIASICVCNGQYVGGGMHFAPMARLSDGKFEVIVSEVTSTLKGLPIMSGLYKGKHLQSPLVHAFQGEHVKVDVLANKAWMDIDGEAPGFAPAEFKIHKNALRLIGVLPEAL